MSYISATDLAFQAGSKPLFEDLSFHINPGDRIGLVGENGFDRNTATAAGAWRKLHVSVDPANSEIVAFELTDSDTSDAAKAGCGVRREHPSEHCGQCL